MHVKVKYLDTLIHCEKDYFVGQNKMRRNKKYWRPSFKKKKSFATQVAPRFPTPHKFLEIPLLLPDVWAWRRWRTSSACGGGGDVVPPTTPIDCLNDHDGLADLPQLDLFENATYRHFGLQILVTIKKVKRDTWLHPDLFGKETREARISVQRIIYQCVNVPKKMRTLHFQKEITLQQNPFSPMTVSATT